MNRRLLWSLLIALILPLAQAAAAAHELSHVRALASDKSAPAALHCDICSVAAAVTGGAATSEAPVILHAPASLHEPASQAPGWHAADEAAFFLSRAPPRLR